MYFNYYSLPALVAALLMFALSLMIRSYRSTPGVRYFSLLMLSGAIYSMFYALEISSSEQIFVDIFYKIQYAGIPFIPAFFILFSISYTRKAEVHEISTLFPVLIVPVITALLAFTNDFHSLFISNGFINTDGAFPVFMFETGLWYWVHQAYSVIAIFSGIVLLFRMWIFAAPAFRSQIGIILSGSLIPFVIYVFYISGVFPGGIDPNPFSFAFTGVFIFAGISRFRLFRLAPMARNMLFDNIPDGVVIIDKYFRLVDCNKSAATMFGIDNVDIGKPAGAVFERWPGIMMYLTGNEKNTRFEVSRISGEYTMFLDCFLSPLIDDINVERGQMLIVHNVTEQRRAEIDKDESEEKFRIIYENAPVGIMYFDSNGIVELCNEYFIKILGSEEDKVIGFNLWQLSDQRIVSCIKRSFQGKRASFEGEYTSQTGNKKVFVKGAFKPLLSKRDNVEGGLCIVEDISARKAAEDRIKSTNEELRRLNAEKDRFFSILAHDLRSPFTAFLGYTDILEESLGSMPLESIKSIAASMKESANNLYGLLENLLQWSRMQQRVVSFNPEEILLREDILNCIEPMLTYANNKLIDVSYDIPGELMVNADTKMFDTIVRNLFTNAVKFTPKHGTIDISAWEASDSRIDICFRDTGIGMSKDILDNLFRLDVKTSRNGTDGELSTGLGLILIKEFVEMHGGRIRVESKEGEGSSFFISLNKAEDIAHS